MRDMTTTPTALTIEGMTCDGCAKAVTRALTRVPGVTDVAVDRPAGRALVTGDAGTEALVAAVVQAGFGARPADAAHAQG